MLLLNDSLLDRSGPRRVGSAESLDSASAPGGRAANAVPAPISHRAGHRARRLRFRTPGAALANFKRRSLDVEFHMHAPVDALGLSARLEATAMNA